MGKPKVTVNCVANQYTGPGERIIEFCDPDTDGPAGGLISFRRNPRGALDVHVYRCDPGVNVVVGRPDEELDTWDTRHTALLLAEEGLRRVLTFVDTDAEELADLSAAASDLRSLRERHESPVDETWRSLIS